MQQKTPLKCFIKIGQLLQKLLSGTLQGYRITRLIWFSSDQTGEYQSSHWSMLKPFPYKSLPSHNSWPPYDHMRCYITSRVDRAWLNIPRLNLVHYSEDGNKLCCDYGWCFVFRRSPVRKSAGLQIILRSFVVLLRPFRHGATIFFLLHRYVTIYDPFIISHNIHSWYMMVT
jgi:hypothetical protein